MRTITVDELYTLRGDEVPLVEGTRLPKIIHQSWKSTTLPPFFARLLESWQQQYPDWLYVLWQDADNLRLVEEHYSEYLDLYRSFPAEIYRADFCRNLYMLKFGGIYIDLDYSSFKSLSPLLREYCSKNQDSAFVGLMPIAKPGTQGYTTRMIYNAIFASVPLHPFWKLPLDQAKEGWAKNATLERGEQQVPVQQIVGEITGPVALTRAADAFHADRSQAGSKGPVLVELPSELVYPYAWYPSVIDPPCDRLAIAHHDKHDFDLEKAVQIYNNSIAYCSTWWSTTWRSNWVETEAGEKETYYGQH